MILLRISSSRNNSGLIDEVFELLYAVKRFRDEGYRLFVNGRRRIGRAGHRRSIANRGTHPELHHVDDLGMRKLGPTAAEELLAIVMRLNERTSTLVTSNRPVEDWGKLLGDSAYSSIRIEAGEVPVVG